MKQHPNIQAVHGLNAPKKAKAWKGLGEEGKGKYQDEASAEAKQPSVHNGTRPSQRAGVVWRDPADHGTQGGVSLVVLTTLGFGNMLSWAMKR